MGSPSHPSSPIYHYGFFDVTRTAEQLAFRDLGQKPRPRDPDHRVAR